jgi:hypothetical protein
MTALILSAISKTQDAQSVIQKLRRHQSQKNPYALPMKQQLILGPIVGIVVGLMFAACEGNRPGRATTARMLRARAQAIAAGNPNYTHAKEVSPTKAMLVFRKDGRTRNTNYFCDSLVTDREA